MAPGKVVALIRGNMEKNTLDRFKPFIPEGWAVTFLDKNVDEAKIIETLSDAEYIISLGAKKVPVQYVENNKKLKLLQNAGQDVGHFPLEWAFNKGIPVANAGGANAIAVAEFTMLLILSCLKKVETATRSIRDGNWGNKVDREGLSQLYDKTVGIIGFGNIGRRVAKLCYAFGANIIYSEIVLIPHAIRADMKAKPVSLNELFKTADIVSLHFPSDPRKPPFIGWDQLSLMKSTAYIINTSRGSNLDEAALIRALEEKKIAGAAIDVWKNEPPSPDNPLLKMPNVFTTPHTAGSVQESIGPALESVWRNILLVSEGKEPLNRIHPYD
jgi:phosphoglycerate dehydrogenase-like enzyme